MPTCFEAYVEAVWRLLLGAAPDAPANSLVLPYSPIPSPPTDRGNREQNLFLTEYINEALAPTQTGSDSGAPWA